MTCFVKQKLKVTQRPCKTVYNASFQFFKVKSKYLGCRAFNQLITIHDLFTVIH